MGDGDLAGSGADVDRANAARMYDYFLGGAHNFAVDRELAERVLASYPGMRSWARGNRAFLMRVVQYCVGQGIRQFLDLGSGIPTVDHVHTTARAIAPETRVAYVDFEPVAVAYSRELLAGVDGVSVTAADVRDPAAVLSSATVTETLDLTRPVAVLAVALMHFVSDDDGPRRMLDGYRAALAPGSVLALTHGSADYEDPELAASMARVAEAYHSSATPGYVRDRAQIRDLLGGHPVVDPGLVDIAHWRADPGAAALGSYAAVTRLG